MMPFMDDAEEAVLQGTTSTGGYGISRTPLTGIPLGAVPGYEDRRLSAFAPRWVTPSNVDRYDGVPNVDVPKLPDYPILARYGQPAYPWKPIGMGACSCSAKPGLSGIPGQLGCCGGACE